MALRSELETAAPVLCATCGSFGRRSVSLDASTENVLRLLLPDVLPVDSVVCWECVALLRRVLRFRADTYMSQRALYLYRTNKCLPKSLSRLTTSQTRTETYQVEENFKDEEPVYNFRRELEIKLEDGSSSDEGDSLQAIKVKMKSELPEDKVKSTSAERRRTREERKTARRAGKPLRKVPGAYVCKECGKQFKTRGTFEYHKGSHREKPQCEDCGRIFVSKSTLWTHRQLVHVDSKKWSCAVCKKVFFSEAGHRAHAANHANDRFYCQPCCKFFKSNSSFRKHLRSAGRHIDPHARKFSCSQCDRKFQTEERARQHYDIIHLHRNKFTCRQCPRQYCTARALRIHERVKHENLTQPRDKVCELCGKGFRTAQVLKSHIRTHTGERPYTCIQCPATFTQSGALHTHVKLVHLHLKRRDKREK